MDRLVKARHAHGYDEVFAADGNLLKFIGLDTLNLNAGESHTHDTEGYEMVAVILSGTVTVEASDNRWTGLGGRTSVFEGLPTSVYLPPRTQFTVTAETDVRLAIVKAVSQAEGLVPFVVTPDEVSGAERGAQNWRRVVNDILTTNGEGRVDSIVVGETISYPGEWSSYPPHRHDGTSEGEPNFEEIYYFEMDPSEGFGAQFHYAEDRSIDDAHMIHSGDAFAIDNGFHPVAVAGGYRLYYLWVMAGDSGRELNPFVHPDQRKFL